jgi:hypothetical protein
MPPPIPIRIPMPMYTGPGSRYDSSRSGPGSRAGSGVASAVRALLLALALLAGCASLKKDTTVCPEYRTLRCMTGTSCQTDKRRGCKVCQCSMDVTEGGNEGQQGAVPPGAPQPLDDDPQ